MTDNKVTNVTALIGALDAQGRRFTDARNAVIAHALSTGVKGSVIALESNVDKGDVSRINKALGTLSEAQAKKIKGLVVSGMTVSDADSIAAAAALGAAHFRRVKATPAPKTAAAATGESEQTDFKAALYDYLMGAKTAVEYEARLALIGDTVEAVKVERAKAALAAAAADAEADAA